MTFLVGLHIVVYSFEKRCIIPIRVQKRNFELKLQVWSIERDKLFRIHSDFENYTLERELV
jgi:hypothetical protein